MFLPATDLVYMYVLRLGVKDVGGWFLRFDVGDIVSQGLSVTN